MNLIGLAATLAALVAQLSTGDPPAQIARFLEHCETSRRGAILQIEHSLRGLRAQKADRETTNRIHRLEDQLRLLNANETPVVPELSFPPQEGAIGRLPGLSCHTEQLLSDDETLVRCFFPVTIATVRDFKRYRERVTRPVDFIVRGVPAKTFQEGADQEMLGIFEVTGREAYQTQSGKSKDVLVLKPFDLKAVEPYLKRHSGR